MKAAYIERHGGPEVLKFGEMPDPVAKASDVVVDIVAASVNGADWKVRAGKSLTYHSPRGRKARSQLKLARGGYVGQGFSVPFQRNCRRN